MNKKVILGTLLASATLLGATSAYATTSDLKAESKKVTVTSDHAKLYKDSTLKESTTPKKGTVYQVDGYRDIDGQHVYRVYQTDKDNKQQYKGYIVNKDTEELKSETASGQYVAKKGATLWNNFYWNSKKAVTSEEKVYFAKYSYTLGDGAKYYSVYYKDQEGKDVWEGYTNASNIKELKATEETKYVTLKKDYNTWANLYFKQHQTDFKAENGVNFKVKRYYTLNGNKFYSTYRTDANGKEVWTGYVNGYLSVVEDLKAEKVDENDQKVQVVKEDNTYSNHFFNKKGHLSKDKILTMKVTYTYGNGKKYASLYDGDTWLGYANIDAVKSASTLLNSANKAIENAKDKLTNSTTDSQKVINNAIKVVEDAIKSNDASQIIDSVNKLNEVVKDAQPVATEEDKKRLNEAIDKGEHYVGNADQTTDRKTLDEAVEKAKKVQEAAKNNNASSKDVENAIKAIEDAINGIKPGETSIDKEAILQLEAVIALLKDIHKIGSDKLNNDDNYDSLLKEAEDVLNKAKDGKASLDKINTVVQSVEEFINGLSLNNSDLEKLINDIKNFGSKVYMTKNQEVKFNEFIKQAEEAIKDNKLSNVEKLKGINKQAEEAKKFVAGQPTEKNVQDLIDAIKEEQKIEKYTKQHANDLFDGWNTVEEKEKDADQILENIKKDDKDGENTAENEYTAESVKNATSELTKSISSLTVNEENTKKFAEAAKKKIDQLSDKKAAQDALTKFENQLKDNYTINNYEAIIATAKDIVDSIQDAETYQSLEEAINKAEAVIKNAKNMNLTNTAAVQTALEQAKAAYNNHKDIAKALESLNEALKKVGLNTTPLKNAVNKLKEVETGVYLTKTQEQQLKEQMEAVIKPIKSEDAQYAPEEKKAIETINKAVKEMNDKQPNKKDADQLIYRLKAIKDINNMPEHGKYLQHTSEVTAPLTKAYNDYEALLKDQPNNNQATQELTKAEIQKDTNDLKDALSKVTLDTSQLNQMISIAKSYNGKRKEEVNEKLKTLESWAEHPSYFNYEHIEGAARDVYDVILHDLRDTVNEVRPWNNNGYTDHETVRYVHSRKLTKQEEQQAVAGSVLTEEQFSDYVVKGAGKVSDYYTKDSYTPFGKDLQTASILTGELEIVGQETPAPTPTNLVRQFDNAKTLGKQLVTERNNLMFDKEKLQELVTKGQKAKDAWLIKENKAGHNKNQKATEQAKQANIGFYRLKTWLGTNPPLNATAQNANTMWIKVYEAMNYYYQYIDSVEWKGDQYVAKESSPKQ